MFLMTPGIWRSRSAIELLSTSSRRFPGGAIPSRREQWLVPTKEPLLGVQECSVRRATLLVERDWCHGRSLCEIPAGAYVLIQSKNKKWNKQGVVIETLANRQYRIKVKAPDYKLAEDALEASAGRAKDYIESHGGTALYHRERHEDDE